MKKYAWTSIAVSDDNVNFKTFGVCIVEWSRSELPKSELAIEVMNSIFNQEIINQDDLSGKYSDVAVWLLTEEQLATTGAVVGRLYSNDELEQLGLKKVLL